MNSNSTDTREIKKFGTIAFVFFGCLCTLGIWLKKPLPMYLFGFLAILGFGFILMPSRMSPIYVFWLKIAHFIGRVITTLFFILAYYLVITPTALIRRIFWERPLAVKPDTGASSYWVKRTEAAQPKERFLKRY